MSDSNDKVINLFKKSGQNVQNFQPRFFKGFQYLKITKDDNGNYFVYSKKYKATIIEKDKYYEIVSNNPDYFVNYFDLNTDYNEIKNKLKKNKILSPMVDYGYGIRILNGDPEEIIYSFINQIQIFFSELINNNSFFN